MSMEFKNLLNYTQSKNYFKLNKTVIGYLFLKKNGEQMNRAELEAMQDEPMSEISLHTYILVLGVLN